MKLIVRMRSGHEVSIELNQKDTPEKPEDAASAFFDAFDFEGSSTLCLDNHIFRMKEIELFRFVLA